MNKLTYTLRRRLLSPLNAFIQDSRAVGITLMACTLIALVWSNTSAGNGFIGFWEKERTFLPAPLHLPHSLVHMINDGLMALFFLLVGMEIRRELLQGELNDRRKAGLPVIAALGGMLLPACLYAACNTDSGYAGGWGVPMATDIAFSLGILSLLGSRAPLQLKVLLTALAIIDDLGAIVAIALFYTDTIHMGYLLGAGGIFAVLLLMNRLRLRLHLPYFVLGIALWYCLFNSGVHATLAGVLLAFALPIKSITRLEHRLHVPVNFFILPLFALANTAIRFPGNTGALLQSPVNYGILAGLILGKPLGITLFSYLAVKLRLASLPADLDWRHILGMGLLAGIGFTMSIFIAMLAFDEHMVQTTAKLGILIASMVSGITGYVFLYRKSVASSSAKKYPE
ncbi:Na+/H+ antiporter NhaA [Taibaiella koreensis]|uniref:Na+/H+ antiporter NhaA n=1 Tax=Taibaiella koreensis TaxID=1268548 RepID=UPI000E59C04A|nr:Na+/H+ antiporter NhaA [Taibaiella koreensis]